MDFAPDIPPLPDDQAYARAAMAVQGRMFRRRETPSDHLLNLTTASESLAKFSSAASTLANSVEAPNEARDNYNDLSRSASRALWLGTLAGLSIARDAHASILIPTKLFTFAPPLTVAIDPQSGEYDRLALQQEYIRTGDAGLTALGRTAVTFVTRWGVKRFSSIAIAHYLVLVLA